MYSSRYAPPSRGGATTTSADDMAQWQRDVSAVAAPERPKRARPVRHHSHDDDVVIVSPPRPRAPPAALAEPLTQAARRPLAGVPGAPRPGSAFGVSHRADFSAPPPRAVADRAVPPRVGLRPAPQRATSPAVSRTAAPRPGTAASALRPSNAPDRAQRAPRQAVPQQTPPPVAVPSHDEDLRLALALSDAEVAASLQEAEYGDSMAAMAAMAHPHLMGIDHLGLDPEGGQLMEAMFPGALAGLLPRGRGGGARARGARAARVDPSGDDAIAASINRATQRQQQAAQRRVRARAAPRGRGARGGVAGDEVDLDAMSYEDILALQERVGSVVVGVPAEVLRQLPRTTIRSAATIAAMAGGDGANAMAQGCSVCLDGFTAGDRVCGLPCHHVFHSDCIDPWLKEHKECPMCKARVCE